jgi:anaerobic magnesium-protoporphyrin IX monomethyl ester cyclase
MKAAFFLCSHPEDDLEHRQYPLGVGYLASLLEASGTEVLVTSVLDNVIKFSPDVVGISSVSQCFNQAVEAAGLIKKALGVPLLLGGYHISALPHRLPQSFDVGVLGEGELPLLRLMSLLSRKGDLKVPDLTEINGICFHSQTGDIIVNRTPYEVPDLDALPFPWRNVPNGYRPMWVLSARGCIYKCRFCASTRHWKKYRPHSAEYVVNEVEHLVKNRNATFIEFLDDLFFADRKRLLQIRDLLHSRGIDGKVSFHGFITSNLANREILEIAKSMGFESIRFGVETGSDRLLKQMKGSWASIENHQRCIDISNQLGIRVYGSFMFGTPGETEEDLQLTYDFLAKNRGALSIAGFYLTTPVPGTPYWDYAERKGIVSEMMDWSCLNLDFLKWQSFDLEKSVYLNEEIIPLARFRKIVGKIGKEFLESDAAGVVKTKVGTDYIERLSACTK